MDKNFTSDYVNYFFQKLTLSPLNEEIADQVESFLTNIIDSNDYTIFTNTIFLNLIYLLDSIETSFIIKHLVREIKLKSLRLTYTNNNQQINDKQMQMNCCDAEQDEELPLFTDLSSLPAPGETSLARKIYQDGYKEFIKTYRIDHTGQALELVSVEINERDHEFETLNNNIIERAIQDSQKSLISSQVPLTEDDL